MNERESTAALVLAAGGSSRLGFPKQLVRYRGVPLVTHAVEQLKQTTAESVHVVLGARLRQVQRVLPQTCLPARNIVVNPHWRDGQGGSLIAGIRTIQQQLQQRSGVVGKLLVVLCDQPQIRVDHLQRLIDEVDAATVCCCTSYPGGGGVPACFRGDRLNDLLCHLAAGGAKQWIRKQPPGSICRVTSRAGTADIDRPEDLTRFADGTLQPPADWKDSAEPPPTRMVRAY